MAGKEYNTTLEDVTSVNGYMNFRDYWRKSNGKSGQKSNWISLKKGQKYKFEAWHHEHHGGDHMTVSVRIERNLTEPDNHINQRKE
jgi:hypothetical protein